MISFQRILWPTDFSEASRSALPAVNGLASQFSATVDVLHVLSPAPSLASMTGHGAVATTEYLKSLEERARSTIKEVAGKEISSDVVTKTTTLMGSPAHEIVNFAEVNDIDLIVIATHGETGLSRLVFGSVAEKVVRHAPCPVLTVPAESPGEQ
jgi:nucleotide-binding universal stress UspA family protein